MSSQATNLNYLNFAKQQRETFKASCEYIAKIESETCSEYQKLLKLTSISIKSMSNAYFKTRCYLGLNDIDKLKESLTNFSSDDSKVKAFKAAIIDDLSNFQEQIIMNHVTTLRKLRSEKALLERSAKQLDATKNKIIMDRLAKIQWPYDEKTKEIDNKITTINIRVERYAKRIEEMETLPPTADEKDLILYQVQLKEKYGVK